MYIRESEREREGYFKALARAAVEAWWVHSLMGEASRLETRERAAAMLL